MKRYQFVIPLDATDAEVLAFFRVWFDAYMTFTVPDDYLEDHPQLEPFAKWAIEYE